MRGGTKGGSDYFRVKGVRRGAAVWRWLQTDAPLLAALYRESDQWRRQGAEKLSGDGRNEKSPGDSDSRAKTGDGMAEALVLGGRGERFLVILCVGYIKHD